MVSLSAHHSTAPFDMTNLETKVHGKVVEFQWMNPHSYIILDVEENGQTHRWRMEGEALALLRRYGWTKDSIKPGDEITCTGARAKLPNVYAMKCFVVTFADGRTLEATPISGSPRQPKAARQ